MGLADFVCGVVFTLRHFDLVGEDSTLRPARPASQAIPFEFTAEHADEGSLSSRCPPLAELLRER